MLDLHKHIYETNRKSDYPLYNCLLETTHFVRTCWLRSAVGGWTTSIRMHAEVSLCKCLFACPNSEDVLTHYLHCPVLRCLAREIFDISAISVSVDARLSIAEPHSGQFILLAFCHSLYHTAVNDKECLSLHLAGDQASLQRRLVPLGRQLRHMILR